MNPICLEKVIHGKDCDARRTLEDYQRDAAAEEAWHVRMLTGFGGPEDPASLKKYFPYRMQIANTSERRTSIASVIANLGAAQTAANKPKM